MCTVFNRFMELVDRHRGKILEPPYRVPDGCVGYTFSVNGKFLGVASFPTVVEWAMVVEDLKKDSKLPFEIRSVTIPYVRIP